jgi:hypothetical protein
MQSFCSPYTQISCTSCTHFFAHRSVCRCGAAPRPQLACSSSPFVLSRGTVPGRFQDVVDKAPFSQTVVTSTALQPNTGMTESAEQAMRSGRKGDVSSWPSRSPSPPDTASATTTGSSSNGKPNGSGALTRVDYPKFVQFFRQASPYIEGHRGKTFVIVVPGYVSTFRRQSLAECWFSDCCVPASGASYSVFKRAMVVRAVRAYDQGSWLN